jgi:hypothetical protein
MTSQQVVLILQLISYHAPVVGIDQTEQTLSIPHQCLKEYRERVKQIYRGLMENEVMSIRSQSVERVNFD